MSKTTFLGGAHLPYYKELSREKQISVPRLPSEVIIPLKQHTGAPCEPLVQPGDEVEAGQKIGVSENFISSTVHASVSGTVKALEDRHYITGELVKSVIIKVEEDRQNVEFKQERDLHTVTKEEIIDTVKEAGIVGMGGAAFPTAVKLNIPPDSPVDTVLINGCECEPYLTCDYRLMMEKSEQLIAAAKILLKAADARKCYFCIEDNKEDVAGALKENIDDPRIDFLSLPTRYPQGAEKQLIYAVLGRSVPSGGLPFHVGTLVQNVATAFALYEAVVYNKPLIERVVTVTGQNIKNTANMLVKIGTPVQHLIQECGGIKKHPAKVIIGGPMTGFSQLELNVPVVKGSNGVVVLPHDVNEEEAYHPCIRCGKCVESCPMLLYPNYISVAAEKEDFEEANKWDVMDCIECGICSYVCLSRRPNSELIKLAKSEVKAQG